MAGRRAVAVWLVEAEENVGVCFAACHIFGEVTETPFVDWAVGVVGEALVAFAPEHGCTDDCMGRGVDVGSNGFVVAVP